jgi:hypothetical protein
MCKDGVWVELRSLMAGAIETPWTIGPHPISYVWCHAYPIFEACISGYDHSSPHVTHTRVMVYLLFILKDKKIEKIFKIIAR